MFIPAMNKGEPFLKGETAAIMLCGNSGFFHHFHVIIA